MTEMEKKCASIKLLNYLVEKFREDSSEYRNIEIPTDVKGKRRILRSLMNVRMPGKLPQDVLKAQDEYLTERAEERGVVKLSDIPDPTCDQERLPVSSTPNDKDATSTFPSV